VKYIVPWPNATPHGRFTATEVAGATAAGNASSRKTDERITRIPH
jgi:hypothetical protein